MAQKYFQSMPVITYDDQSVRDILTRVRIDDLNVDVMSFLSYTISEYDRHIYTLNQPG